MIADQSGFEAGGGPLKPKSGKSVPKKDTKAPVPIGECNCAFCRRLDEITDGKWRIPGVGQSWLSSYLQRTLEAGKLVVVLRTPTGIDLITMEAGAWKW